MLANRGDALRAQYLLSLGVARATARPLRALRTAPLFRARRTELREQVARYFISVGLRDDAAAARDDEIDGADARLARRRDGEDDTIGDDDEVMAVPGLEFLLKPLGDE